ncbi:hypothetical protein N007_11995 [Alicyclobacillus acidoterrestris ATCC 49025]|nr:hypothetical protein N007_11995 [Alicyclobacillus acidoterrestris ATCC 49025]
MNETASTLLIMIIAIWLVTSKRFQAFLTVVKS